MSNVANRCISVVAVFAAGVTMGLILLLTPILFAIGIGALCLKLFFEFRAWRRLSVAEQEGHARPGHLMNLNHTLSAKAEWVIALVGFAGTVSLVPF